METLKSAQGAEMKETGCGRDSDRCLEVTHNIMGESKLKYCECKEHLLNTRGEIRSIALSSNGLWLAAAAGHFLVVWNLETGKEFFSFDGRNEAHSVFWLENQPIVYCAFATGWLYTTHMSGTVCCFHFLAAR